MTPEQVKEAADELLTHPENYVGIPGTYADGYLDGLLDMLAALSLVTLPLNYVAMRRASRV